MEANYLVNSWFFSFSGTSRIKMRPYACQCDRSLIKRQIVNFQGGFKKKYKAFKNQIQVIGKIF